MVETAYQAITGALAGYSREVKKKAKPTTWTAASGFAVYPDDIRDLWGIVEEVAPRVVIETDEYAEIESPDLLFSLPYDRVSALSITGYRGDDRAIEVQLDPRSGSVWVAEERADLLGALTKAKKVIWRHTEKVTTIIAAAALLIGGAAVALTSSTVGPQVTASFVGIVGGGVVSFLFLRRPSVRIYLKARSARSGGLLSRRGEDIAIALATGLIVGLVYFALGFVVKP